MAEYLIQKGSGRYEVWHHGQVIWHGASRGAAESYIHFLTSNIHESGELDPVEEQLSIKWILEE